MNDYKLNFGSVSLILFLIATDSNFAQTPQSSGFSGSRHVANSKFSKPLVWDEKINVIWKLNLPGPGASSPVIVGEYVFITCYSGYGVNSRNPGKLGELVRHLICLQRQTGKIVWQVKIEAGDVEDPLNQQISDHGYASSTPTSDGNQVYSFFGKAGLYCHDLNGNEVWRAKVGNNSSRFKQGSGSSPVLYGDFLIVNAADESRAIIAFNKFSGKEVWRNESEKLDGSYVTPVIAKTKNGEDILVVSMIGESWGLNPNDGSQRWKLATNQNGSIVPTPIIRDGIIYLFGGMGGSSYAINGDARGELNQADATWVSRLGSIVPSPLYHNGHLYWTTMNGIACCIKSSDGTQVYKNRLGKRAGCYASPILIGDYIYYVSRNSGTFVVPAKPTFSKTAHNTIESDQSRFDGTPVFVDDRLYLRSQESIYCIGEKFSESRESR